MKGLVRIISKNEFTLRTLTLLFEQTGYTVTDAPDEAELTVTDMAPTVPERRGAYVYLADRGSALPKGADAVVEKPFSWEKLLEAAEAVICERNVREGVTLRADTLVYKGKSTKLTEREARLFEFFKSRENTPVTREEMLACVWNDSEKSTNITDVYVNYLRKKLKSAFGADFIKSVRGVGYIYSEA